MSSLKEIFEQKQALTKQILALEAKAAAIKIEESKKINKATDQLRKILLEAGISGSVTLWLDGNDLQYEINTAERTKTQDLHLSKESYNKIKVALERNRPIRSKKGHYALNGYEVPVTQLVEFALISGIRENVGEILKFLPEITVGQAAGVLKRWTDGAKTDVEKAVKGQ